MSITIYIKLIFVAIDKLILSVICKAQTQSAKTSLKMNNMGRIPLPNSGAYGRDTFIKARWCW